MHMHMQMQMQMQMQMHMHMHMHMHMQCIRSVCELYAAYMQRMCCCMAGWT